MRASIQINDIIAVYEGGEWSCDDPMILALIREIEIPISYRIESKPSRWAAIAYYVATELGGIMIDADVPER